MGETEEVEVPAETGGGAEPPSVEEMVNDETIDLTSTGLPDKTIAEIKRLRSETKQYRTIADTWGPATSKWNDDDLAQLRQALEVGPDDPAAIGQWMLDQGKRLTGATEPEPAVADPPPEEDGKLTVEQVEKLLEERLAERDKKSVEERELESRINAIKAETEDLGFGPSHKMHKALLLMARDDHDGDLAAAAEALIESGVKPSTIEASTKDAPAEAGTPVPPEGGTPAGTQRIRDPKAAAMERLNKVLPAGQQGFSAL